MNRRTLGTLIVLNGVLLVALVLVVVAPQPAEAQLRGHGEYAMVSGRVLSNPTEDVVYIFDLVFGRTVAVYYRSANDEFVIVGAYDFAGEVGGRRR